MVGLGRLELPASRLSGARSYQLSYRPEIFQAGLRTTLGSSGSNTDPGFDTTTKLYNNVRRRSESPGIDLGVNAVTAAP